MIKVENVDVWGFEHAIRGMRNPMNSWDKSDTVMELVLRHDEEHAKIETKIGENDLQLMRKLYKAGSEHRKYLRQIFVSMDIIAPLYWWKEFDTYKIGTVSNSCSTMHKIHAKKFELDDFSHDHLSLISEKVLIYVVQALNDYRQRYLQSNEKVYWWQMIQLLPSSYNQRRTITMNYENVVTIIKQRAGHKLDEWREFIDILGRLPYVDEITTESEAENEK